MDLARKYAFGKMLVIGSQAPFKVKGLWLFRGQEIPQFVIDECYDMELYKWTKMAKRKSSTWRRLMLFVFGLNMMESMFFGFSASIDKRKASAHYILGWSFALNGVAPPLDYALLPKPPPKEKHSQSFPWIKVIIGMLSALTFILLCLFLYVTLYKRYMVFETLEDWEMDCPHRFRYRDLHLATKGFVESQLIGVGGFGSVYKGVLPRTGTEVAVKRILRTPAKGMREFAAEIESLGRLRHKNLVNLQGWCKHKNDLLLVYDYIPNESLDSLLFSRSFVLDWDQRFRILKGVGAGLLYLHEEWEQVVIHKDVKSSNISA
ncbi:lectin-domain containing receptor kinase VI.4-like [Vigna umbellata]|uniref:lectin-domain containing receptor kinase VI.4-like n=1 Tax=Vigna umbellata TaxID=87088 RepID=UPI001F5F570F|nr:lectin-domain containing receptor kinase VI.4-like [Vigna umbellata]